MSRGKTDIEILKKALEREKIARKQAESILEVKSINLLKTSEELNLTNEKLKSLLTEKSNQLQGVFENINDAYVVIDFSGNVLKMNNIAREMFHFFDEENNELIDLSKDDINSIKITKKIPGKKIKSIEILVKVASSN